MFSSVECEQIIYTSRIQILVLQSVCASDSPSLVDGLRPTDVNPVVAEHAPRALDGVEKQLPAGQDVEVEIRLKRGNFVCR